MKIVIDIPDRIYKISQSRTLNITDAEILEKALRSGIPLPKGHGRLKDVDHYVKMQWENPDYSLMDDEPTIIEADTESEEK